MTITLYGIKNCDTVKKARAWLDGEGIAYRFHDFRADGLNADRLNGWAARLGWEKLLNKAGTTFRALPAEDKDGLDSRRALALMAANPTLIKRPVLEAGDALLIGFKDELYAAQLR